MNEIVTVSTTIIEAIISREEIIYLLDNNKIDKSNLVLISISDPFDKNTDKGFNKMLNNKQIDGFKDVLQLSFWDIEEDFCKYKVISNENANLIRNFILKNIDNRFIINCEFGRSRSAAIGKAVECIKYFGLGQEAKDKYFSLFNSEIDKIMIFDKKENEIKNRYIINKLVFDKIILNN